MSTSIADIVFVPSTICNALHSTVFQTPIRTDHYPLLTEFNYFSNPKLQSLPSLKNYVLHSNNPTLSGINFYMNYFLLLW